MLRSGKNGNFIYARVANASYEMQMDFFRFILSQGNYFVCIGMFVFMFVYTKTYQVNQYFLFLILGVRTQIDISLRLLPA